MICGWLSNFTKDFESITYASLKKSFFLFKRYIFHLSLTSGLYPSIYTSRSSCSQKILKTTFRTFQKLPLNLLQKQIAIFKNNKKTAVSVNC